MVSYDRSSRPQAIEICQQLIEAQQFSMDALEKNHMKALILQLITAFNPEKSTSLKQQKKVSHKFSQTQTEESKLSAILLKSHQAINPLPYQTIQKAIQIPTFESIIIEKQFPSTLILSLFQDSNIALEKIHSQTITKYFDCKKFHLDCDKQGSTLVIFKSSQEPNSFFGGMAIPEWQSPKDWQDYKDPEDKQSWLFKVELEGKKINLHQWKCIDKENAICCHKNCGPYFVSGLYGYGSYLYGGLYGGSGLYLYGGGSQLPSNNNQYQKQDLTQQLSNENNLLCQLSKTINVSCPTKVIGKIMNEEYIEFQLSACEIFRIKQ